MTQYPQYLHYVAACAVLFLCAATVDRVNGAPLKWWTLWYVTGCLAVAKLFFSLGAPQ